VKRHLQVATIPSGLDRCFHLPGGVAPGVQLTALEANATGGAARRRGQMGSSHPEPLRPAERSQATHQIRRPCRGAVGFVGQTLDATDDAEPVGVLAEVGDNVEQVSGGAASVEPRGQIHADSMEDAVRFVVGGASGLIGTALVAGLESRGHDVVRLVRTKAGPGDSVWDPQSGRLEASVISGADVVVNLAGAGIGDKRWTADRKELLVRSRVESTALLAQTMVEASDPPGVFLSGSAVGFYGDRGDEELDETSPPGEGFVADLCQQWESAARPAAEAGVRVVNLRTAVVLTPHGGALAKQLPLFRFGVGGRLGSGRQWFPWISMTDEVRAIMWAAETDVLDGPVNLAAPGSVTNRELTRLLAGVLGRPAVLPVPRFVLRVALGEMTGELLASAHICPRRLLDSGFSFEHPDLTIALEAVLATQKAARKARRKA